MGSHKPLFRVLFLAFSLCVLLRPALLRADDAAAAPPSIVPTLPTVFVIQGTTPVVAVQPLVDLIGASLNYDKDNLKYIVVGNGHTFSFAVNTLDAMMDDKAGTLKVMPFLRGTTVYVQYIALLKSLGIKEDYPVAAAPAPGMMPEMVQIPASTSFMPPGKDVAIKLPVVSAGPLEMFHEYYTQLYTVTLADNTVRRISYTQAQETLPALSADGKTLLYTNGADLFSRDVTNPKPTKLLQAADTNGAISYAGVSYMPDGKHLLLIQTEKGNMGPVSTANLAELNGSNAKQIISDLQANSLPNIRPDGVWMSFIGKNPATGQYIPYISFIDGKSHMGAVSKLYGNQACSDLVFSPDSTMFAIGIAMPPSIPAAPAPGVPAAAPVAPTGPQYTVGVVLIPSADTQLKKYHILQADWGTVPPHPIFAPDSQSVLFIKTDGLYLMTHKHTDDGKLAFDVPKQPLVNATGITLAKYSPDGLKIYYVSNGDIYCVKAADGSEKQHITMLGTVRDFAFDPANNGLLLFTAYVESNGMMGMPGGPGGPMNPGGPMGNPGGPMGMPGPIVAPVMGVPIMKL